MFESRKLLSSNPPAGEHTLAQPLRRDYGKWVRLVPGKSIFSPAVISHAQQGSLGKWHVQQGSTGSKSCPKPNLLRKQERSCRPQFIKGENEEKDLLELIRKSLVIESY